MFEPKIVKAKEIEKLKCDNWTYSYDENYTHIYNQLGEKVVMFYIKLEQKEVEIYKAGFENGFTSGKEYGRVEKGEEIKKALKI